MKTYEEYREELKTTGLPADFPYWDMCSSKYPNRFKRDRLAIVALWDNRLPDGFNRWDIADADGRTVAHDAAFMGRLPSDFNQWCMRSIHGLTVAHAYLSGGGQFTDDFQYWDLEDSFGKNLFYRALCDKKLPDGFDFTKPISLKGDTGYHLGMASNYFTFKQIKDYLMLTNYENHTVAHNFARHKKLPVGFKHWDFKNDFGESIAHVAAKHNTLPIGFRKWDIKDNLGVSVAHVAAKFGNLPSDFDRWDIADDNGWTVAHEHHFSLSEEDCNG